MKTSRRFLPALVLALIPAAPLPASPRALSLVPAGATAAGGVRLDRIRESEVRDRLFREADRMAADGEAARFLEEAGLDLRRDVDSVTFWMSGAPGTPRAAAAFEGHFDVARLSAATVGRGAAALTQPPYTYLRLPNGKGEPTAIAYVNSGLVLAGSEPGVRDALRALAAGGSGGTPGALRAGLSRVDERAAAWVVVDGAQLNRAGTEAGAGAPEELARAFRSVSALVFQASLDKDGLAVRSTGLSSDAETRRLLEDLVRGVLAGWRLAADEKDPRLVAALRAFTVAQEPGAVTVSGKLPFSAFPAR
jgi:hypothetical protein